MSSFIPALFSIHGAKRPQTGAACLFPGARTQKDSKFCPALRQRGWYLSELDGKQKRGLRSRWANGSLEDRFETQFAPFAIGFNDHCIRSDLNARNAGAAAVSLADIRGFTWGKSAAIDHH